VTPLSVLSQNVAFNTHFMPPVTAMPGPHKGSLLVVFLTVFIDMLGFGMVLPLLSIYARDFGAADEGLWIGLLVASFSAMQFIFSPIWGRLSDRIGRRPVLMMGLAGSAVCYGLFGLATVWNSLAWLFISRLGAGVFGATITTAQAYIADVTSQQTRGKGMTLVGIAFGLGFTLGPMFGGLALLSDMSHPRPEPGYAAAVLSAGALVLAYFKLTESRRIGSTPAATRLFDFTALRDALRIPSIGPLLASLFVCVLAFSNFESTLPLLLTDAKSAHSLFRFDLRDVMLTFACLGGTIVLAQALVVRRLLGKIPDGAMATSGAVSEILGFAALVAAVQMGSRWGLFAAVTLLVLGLAMVMPSLNSLISRRSDPVGQGGILGIGQSIGALARILGPLLGIPLLQQRVFLPLVLPYVIGGGLMAVGLAMVVAATRGGQDFGLPAAGAEQAVVQPTA
jgi:MFS transporter, DHA1 family, tetracycline resistance protein